MGFLCGRKGTVNVLLYGGQWIMGVIDDDQIEEVAREEQAPAVRLTVDSAAASDALLPGEVLNGPPRGLRNVLTSGYGSTDLCPFRDQCHSMDAELKWQAKHGGRYKSEDFVSDQHSASVEK